MSPARGESAKQVFVAVAVSLWATLDGLTGIVVACIAAFTQPLIVFVAAAILFIVINTACCTWVDHHWGMWSEGRGKFVEKRLEKCAKAGSCDIRSSGSPVAQTASSPTQRS